MDKAKRLIAGVALLFVFNVSNAQAHTTEISEISDFRVVGSGILTLWGIPIYRATLYSSDGVYISDRTHALHIDYYFGISRDDLAEQSLEEMEKLFGARPEKSRQQEELAAVFKDVVKGDHLTGIHYVGQGAVFYANGKLIGRLGDSKLASEFFAIWLSSDTREPKLRSSLLGEG